MKILEDKKALIYPEVLKFLPNKAPEGHYALVRDYPERKGKYFRGALVLLSCAAFGGDERRAVRTAAAFQLSEDWILIHDDIEDHSDNRRGKPCLHNLVGEELAINAGDTLHMLMWRALIDNEEVLGHKLTFDVLRQMSDILLKTAEGQYIEIAPMINGWKTLTDADYYEIVDHKTGWYTITGPLVLGALIAGAGKKHIAALKQIGVPVGRAFQIQDDLLNIVGDEKKYGKEIGGDILEGKRTLMLAHVFSNCSSSERNKLIKIYSGARETRTASDVKYVINLMKKYESIDFARRKAREFAEQANKLFDEHFADLSDSLAKRNLRAAIEFVINRDV